MPKEAVYGSRLPYGRDVPGEEGPGRSIVETLWGRETEYVQVVSRCIDAVTGANFVQQTLPEEREKMVDDLLAKLRPPTDLVQAEAREMMLGWLADGIHYTDGFYVDLDRRGINALIRNLRRARDQAFGRDE